MKMSSMLHNLLLTYMARAGLLLTALPLTVAKLEDISDAAQRGLYVADGTGFKLDITGMPVQEDVTGLKTSLAKERENFANAEKARKALETQFAGIDPAKYKAIMTQFETDEEAALIAAGNIKEVVTRRTSKFQTEMQKQLDAAKASEEGALEVAATFMQQVLDNNVRAAATKAGLHPSAIEDALFRARTMFELDDNGQPVQTDSTGAVVLGKDGKTPFSPMEWLETMKDTAPHWFPASGSGGGAGGSGSKDNGANVVKRAIFEAKSPMERSVFLKAGGKIID